MTMISVLAVVLLLIGTFILIFALLPICKLIGQLPAGSIRQRWHAMMVLIFIFILGYIAYTYLTWNQHQLPINLIVPGIFFFGACFVWLTATLSLQTTTDVMRISRLEIEVSTDPLTGVHNRRYLDQRLEEDVTSALRYKLPLSVLMLDIDHFKRVNDQHGHPAGDAVLIMLGSIVSMALRDSDTLARYGGEEFLIITPHTSLVGAAELAERLRKRIEAHAFTIPNSAESLSVTVSIGIASLDDEINGSEKLVQTADANLYRAKGTGRNRVVYGPALAETTASTEQVASQERPV